MGRLLSLLIAGLFTLAPLPALADANFQAIGRACEDRSGVWDVAALGEPALNICTNPGFLQQVNYSRSAVRTCIINSAAIIQENAGLVLKAHWECVYASLLSAGYSSALASRGASTMNAPLQQALEQQRQILLRAAETVPKLR